MMYGVKNSAAESDTLDIYIYSDIVDDILDFSDLSEKIRGVVRFCVFFYPFSPTF